MKTNKTRSIYVYTCTIYTYMHPLHHQIPPKCKIYLVGLPSVLYERPDQNEISVLNQLFLLFLRFFSVVFICFSCTFHEKCSFSYKKCYFSWKLTKPAQCVYTCIIYTYMHHENIRYSKLAFPLYSMKDQVKMRDLSWISCFCCFSGAFQCFSCTFHEKCYFSWKKKQNQVNMCVYMHHLHMHAPPNTTKI